MGTGADEFYRFSAAQLLAALNGRVDLSTNRIVGFYGEVGAGMNLGLGGEGIYFRGVDTRTGQLVEAYYAGATLGAGATPGTVGAGVFGFTGGVGSLSGWSIGAQGSSGITGGISIASDGSVLHFYGLNTSLSVNASGGYTYSVSVEGERVYFFGSVVQIPDFSESSQVLDVLRQLPSTGHPDSRTVNYTTAIDGTPYMLRQSIIKAGDALIVNTYILDADGNVVSNAAARALLAAYGVISSSAWSDDIWARRFYASDDVPVGGTTVSDFYTEISECFLSGTMIDMWPVETVEADADHESPQLRPRIWQKPIEHVQQNDLVVSFDAQGNLRPGRVTRLFRTTAKIVLDYFGTGVTPGHVYYRVDSTRPDKFETLIDILRDDGVIQSVDGLQIRAATGAVVDSPADRFVWAITGDQLPDRRGITIRDKGRIRLGTRVLIEGGRDICIADLIGAMGGEVSEDGLIMHEGIRQPFHWIFGENLPKPEDYILQRSGTTLADIYRADEWEALRPYLPRPLTALGEAVTPLDAEERRRMHPNKPRGLQAARSQSDFIVEPPLPHKTVH